MTANLYTKDRQQNPNTGQVKAVYGNPHAFDLVARGLANLRGKDSGTMQDVGNILNEYHYLRVKTMQTMKDGDVIADIKDAGGLPYLSGNMKFVVLGVTPTFDPFGNFVEYDIICNVSETDFDLPTGPLLRTAADRGPAA